MKHTLLVFLFLTIFTNTSFCQNTLRDGIKRVVDKKTYDYIPLSYLKDTAIIGLLHPIRIGEKLQSNEQFEIHWNSSCIDGSYYMVVTPEQIYFISSHENPNPNLLFWVLPIDGFIYHQIVLGFQRQTKASIKQKRKIFGYFDSSYNDKKLLNDTNSKQFEESCEFEKEKQIEKFFAQINQFIGDKNKKLDKLNRVMAINPIYYAWNEQIIKDWTPVIMTN